MMNKDEELELLRKQREIIEKELEVLEKELERTESVLYNRFSRNRRSIDRFDRPSSKGYGHPSKRMM